MPNDQCIGEKNKGTVPGLMTSQAHDLYQSARSSFAVLTNVILMCFNVIGVPKGQYIGERNNGTVPGLITSQTHDFYLSTKSSFTVLTDIILTCF